MEGGTEHDLLSLDQKQSSVDDEEEESKKKEKTGGDAKKSDSKGNTNSKYIVFV